MEEQPWSGRRKDAARSRQPDGRRGGTYLVTRFDLYGGGTVPA